MAANLIAESSAVSTARARDEELSVKPRPMVIDDAVIATLSVTLMNVRYLWLALTSLRAWF